jgi:N-acetylneuraminate synthase/N,N'-diacetyllegionaminate synthase
LTRLACNCGIDAVKYQIYTGDSLVSQVESPDRHQHFQRFELTREQYSLLAKECREHDVTFCASVWDPSAIEWIDPFLIFYKVGSGDLTAYPLLDRIAATGKPIIVSTGLATLQDVAGVVERLQNRDVRYGTPEYLALLQCTSMYPIPPEDANLRVMDVFRQDFSATVGYSDHTVGAEALEVAVAMGAEILEFHFTDQREGRSFRDHQVSLTPNEVTAMVDKIGRIRTLRGGGHKEPVCSEIESGHVSSFRRAVYPVRDFAAGTRLSEEDLTVLRPAHGIEASEYARLVGRKLRRSVKALRPLDWDDFER